MWVLLAYPFSSWFIQFVSYIVYTKIFFLHGAYLYPLYSHANGTDIQFPVNIEGHHTVSLLTLWRRNFFFFILAHTVYNMNKTGTKYVRIMKQTAF